MTEMYIKVYISVMEMSQTRGVSWGGGFGVRSPRVTNGAPKERKRKRKEREREKRGKKRKRRKKKKGKKEGARKKES